jgi:hypothetical protein
MSRFNSTLDHVRVAAPCDADWESMFGDERVRFCGQCQLNVYNLSEMSKQEAEQLIGRTERRLCVRYYQRLDGSIITRNCPVGLRAIKRRLSRIATAVGSAILSFLAGIGFYEIADRFSLVRRPMMGDMAVTGVMVATPEPPTIVTPVSSPPSSDILVMGKMFLIEKQKPVNKRMRAN